MLGCVAVAFAVVVGGVYAITEAGLCSGSKSGSSRSKRDRDDRYDRDYYAYDAYDDDYGYDDYDDYDYGGYTPQPSYYDCPACTNGYHDLCDGSGIYRNYGEEVECSCNNGRCNICDGSGIIYN